MLVKLTSMQYFMPNEPLLGSALVKAAHRMLVKLTTVQAGVNFIDVL